MPTSPGAQRCSRCAAASGTMRVTNASARDSAHSAIIGPNDSGVRVSTMFRGSATGCNHESTPAPVHCTQRTLPIVGNGGRLNPM